jgi:hypothetical protein
VEGSTVSFRVEADFIAGDHGGAPRVDLRLTGLRRSESPAAASPPPSPAPAAPPEVPPPAPVAVPSPPAAAAAPPVEVLGPLPGSPAPPVAPAPEVPVSAVRDVTLSVGVPDLTKGRRPVVPPLARMASATGTVEVRFAVDAAGASSVQEVSGPELLKEAAQQTVASWVFRRTTTERLHLAASFVYGAAAATATVRKEE